MGVSPAGRGPAHPGRAPLFKEFLTPREGRAEDGESRVEAAAEKHGGSGSVGTRGSGCAAPRAGIAPRHISPVPRGPHELGTQAGPDLFCHFH